jgi:plasmid stabilization system protein ParE
MAYTISLTATAEADVYAAFDRIREVAPASAATWLASLFAAIRTLADMPARCPVRSARKGVDLRRRCILSLS